MPALELFAVRGRALRAVSHAFEPGIHALVGGPAEEAAELVRLAAGVLAPKAGRVRVLGQDPFSSPRVRAAIGSLLPDEEPPGEGRVQDGVRLALALHGVPEPDLTVFDRLGLRSLLRRSASSLSSLELRAVALGTALCLPDPALLVLHEPFTVCAGRDALARELRERAGAGSVVLVVLSSRMEATELGATPVALGPAPGGDASVARVA